MEVAFYKIAANDSHWQHDDFAGVYSNLYINFAMLFIYSLGLVVCIGLGMVIWFERSGQAGPYRTLVNQLVSYRIEQTIYFQIFGFIVPAVRIFAGPLNHIFAVFTHFFIIFTMMNVLLLSIAVAAVRFSYIFIFRSIPNMNDPLLVTLILRIITVWNFFATAFKIFFEEKHLILVRILTGTWSDEDLNLSGVPLAAITAMITFVTNILLSLAIKSTKITLVLPFNHQNQVSLGSLFATFLTNLTIFIMAVAFLIMEKIRDPLELNQFPKVWMVHIFFYICPSALVITQFAYFFFSNKQLRNAVKNVFL